MLLEKNSTSSKWFLGGHFTLRLHFLGSALDSLPLMNHKSKDRVFGLEGILWAYQSSFFSQQHFNWDFCFSLHPGMAKYFLLGILDTLFKCTFNTVISHMKPINRFPLQLNKVQTFLWPQMGPNLFTNYILHSFHLTQWVLLSESCLLYPTLITLLLPCYHCKVPYISCLLLVSSLLSARNPSSHGSCAGQHYLGNPNSPSCITLSC